MDAQGALDAKMGAKQAANFFGLASALSTTLVYNISKKIDQGSLENLHVRNRSVHAGLILS